MAPREEGSVGGAGDAVDCSSRHSDDALASKGLDLLGQELGLLVAVAQAAKACIAPALESAVGGEGEAVAYRHSNDMLPFEGLDLAGPRSVSLSSVAEAAVLSRAPCEDDAVNGNATHSSAPWL